MNQFLKEQGGFGLLVLFRIRIIYGYYTSSDNARLWQELLEIKTNSDVPLFLMGDFNEVRVPKERNGCTDITSNMVNFDMWINNMGLIELPLTSRKYTWRRDTSCSRIDRAFVDPHWL